MSVFNDVPPAEWTLTTDVGVTVSIPCSPWRYEYVPAQQHYRVYCESVVYIVSVTEAARLIQQSRIERTAKILNAVFKDK